jgi:hypothetical protein
MRVAFEIPGPLPSVSNLREHWATRARRTKKQRQIARLLAIQAVSFAVVAEAQRHGAEITLRRYGKRILDSGNLESAFKAVQDGVADALGIDDGDPRLAWRYQQATTPSPVRVAVVIETRPAPPGAVA